MKHQFLKFSKGRMLGIMSGLLLLPCAASAQSSTSTDIFDFSPWEDNGILKLFAEVADKGRKFPTQEEFEAAGIYLDGEFVRSHVAYRPILEQNENVNIVKGVFPTRRLWMNLPSGYGPNVGGFPSSTFNSDTYSLWNYTHIFGSWNHSINQAPGSWTDAAHKNGTYIYSGIKFFESWGTTSSSYNKFITTRNPDGSFKYVDALLNALIYFGHDGINYNFEDNGFTKADVVEFHRALYKRAAEIGFDSFHIGMYTASSYLSNSTTNYLLGNKTQGKICDVMLNYSANQIAYSRVPESLEAAKNAMGTAEDVYQGAWICTMDQYWTQMAEESRKEMNLCLWGEHSISRFFMYVVGSTMMNLQQNYQLLLEKTFSGGNRNPMNRPVLKNGGNVFQVGSADLADTQMKKFGGLASMIPERSSIKGTLPFNTYFSLGNGESYLYKGKKTHGSWYNMSQQDYVPTYRWLVTKSTDNNTVSNDIDVRFTHEDAWIGGSSIRLSGATAGSDVILYRTELDVTGQNVVANVALKCGKNGTNASNLSLILKKRGSENWIEIPYGNTSSAAWECKELAVNSLSPGDVIEYIGLRVAGSDNDYNMLVGQIGISDGRRDSACGSIDESSLLVEVKEETATSLSVKMNWNVDATGFNTSRGEYGMVFNDEVNIDHFEVFVKDGESGNVREVSRTASWCAYIGNIRLDSDSEPYVGVRAVATDLKTFSPIVWAKIDRYTGELPEGYNDAYDPSYLNEFSDNAATALETRYIEEIYTKGADEDINYTRNEPVGGNNYIFEKDYVIKCRQGQDFDFYFRGADLNDNLQYCFIKGYIDWDINHDFDTAASSDEILFEAGALNSGTKVIVNPGMTIKVHVPEDAAIGTSRLRIVASDAWFAHPGPYGGTTKGFTLDLPVEISGDNTPREAAVTYKDLRDAGDAEEPEGINVPNDIVIATAEPLQPAVENVDGILQFSNVDKAWIFDAAGRVVMFVAEPSSLATTNLDNGVYVVRMQSGHIVRSTKFVK